MQKSKNFFKIVILSMVLGLGVSYIYAWTNPTGEPPAGNVAAPINIGGTAQTKNGAFGVNGAFRVFQVSQLDGMVGIGGASDGINALKVTGKIQSTGDICTDLGGGKCLSTAGGGGGGSGTITSISQGTGITLSPNPITTTGSISVNTNSIQARVSGSCSAGQSIRAIDSNGNVTCEVDDVGGGGGDNLGNHIATQNIRLNSFYLSGDGGNEGILVDSSGNVGIGVASPSQRLDVNGYVRGTSGLCISNDCRSSWPSGGGVTDHGALTGRGDDDHTQYLLTNGSRAMAGNLIFPSGMTIYSTAGDLYVRGSNWLRLGSGNANDRMVLDGSGNVGIGVGSPSQRLDVNGYVRGISGLCINNDCRASWPGGDNGSLKYCIQCRTDDDGTWKYGPERCSTFSNWTDYSTASLSGGNNYGSSGCRMRIYQ